MWSFVSGLFVRTYLISIWSRTPCLFARQYTCRGGFGFDPQKLRTNHKLPRMLIAGRENRAVYTQDTHKCFIFLLHRFSFGLLVCPSLHSCVPKDHLKQLHVHFWRAAELAKCSVKSVLNLDWPLRLSSSRHMPGHPGHCCSDQLRAELWNT